MSLFRLAALLLPAAVVAQPLPERPSVFREAPLPAPSWRPHALPDSRFAPQARPQPQLADVP